MNSDTPIENPSDEQNVISLFWNIQKEIPSPPLLELLRLARMPPPYSLDRVVSFTQKAWLRSEKKERWELGDKLFEILQRKRYLQFFSQLSLIDPILPKKQTFDGILLLGTSHRDFLVRTRALKKFLANHATPPPIYVLTGNRLLAKIEQQALPEPLHLATETEMTAYVANEILAMPFELIAVDKPITSHRPTTADTIVQWEKQKKPRGHFLLISSQPFGYYQKIVSINVLHDKTGISYSLLSPKSDKEYFSIKTYLDTLARILFEIHQVR